MYRIRNGQPWEDATPHAGGGAFDHGHLYINDHGVCYCGRHMGVESTFMPHAWSDLGATEFVVHDDVTIRCEDPACQRKEI